MTKLNAMIFRFPLPAIALLFLSALPAAAEPPPPVKTEFSPIEYGARFDGVTDDTEAWKRAIAQALQANYGAAITVPAGRSLVRETLRIPLTGNKAIAIRGMGADVSEIVWTEPVDGITVSFKDHASHARDAFATGGKFSFEGVSLIHGAPFTKLVTSAGTPSGNTLHFASTKGLAVGMYVSSHVNKAKISASAAITAVTDTSVTLSEDVTGEVPAGTELVFFHIANSALRINGDSNQRFGVESPELYIRDTSIHGFSGGDLFTPGGSWLNGIVCNNQTVIRIDGAYITFSRCGTVGTGILIQGEYPTHLSDDHHLTNIKVLFGDVGINLGNGNPGFEGLFVENSSLVGCERYGIWAHTSNSITDELTVTGCHINAGRAAFKVNGMTQVGLANNFVIVGCGAGHGAEAVGFDFKNVACFTLTGNLLQFDPKNAGGGWGVIVDNDAGWGDKTWSSVIGHNSFMTPRTGGMAFRNHAANILVNGNSIVTAGKPVEVAETAKVNVGINQINGEMVGGFEKK
ncbi:MAG: glycosyl hydrolase family 28-related protein [Verrucomicrobia bacterium]|nr:glycosyl hydrolase family 28-related protein [Verrucomicrobiota bacterium]